MEWVKLSLFVHVTVVPTGTVMSSVRTCRPRQVELARGHWSARRGGLTGGREEVPRKGWRVPGGGDTPALARKRGHGGERACAALALRRRAAQPEDEDEGEGGRGLD